MRVLDQTIEYMTVWSFYQDTNACDGFAFGPGPLDCGPHPGDCEAPFGELSALEVAPVLAYWRAGGYHCDFESTWCDGYGAGPWIVQEASAPLLPTAEPVPAARAVQQAAELDSARGVLWVTNTTIRQRFFKAVAP